MRKGINQSILFAGAIIFGLIILVFVYRGAVAGEGGNETQAILMADFIARSASSLSSMEEGVISRKFEKPADIEIFEKTGTSCFLPWQDDCGTYVKVSYKLDDDEKSSELRVFGDINLISLSGVDHVYVIKEPFRAVDISSLGKDIEDCIEPTFSEIVGFAEEAAQTHGVELSRVLSIIETESRFSQCARSGAGAIGLMQLIPGTAADLGVDPYDPEDNVFGGTKYYSQQLKTYNEHELALAAYNAGPGRVNGWRECIGNPSASWQIILSNIQSESNPNGKIIVTKNPVRNNKCHMPLETRNYVDINLCYHNSCYALLEDRCNAKCRA